jgi:hypothetical protein
MLYKYVPQARIDVLENLLIRFTQPGAFNDPFEMRPDFQLLSKVDQEKLPKADQYGAGGVRLLTPEAVTQMLEIASAALMRKAASASGSFALDNNDIAQAFFDEQLGVLSLAEAPDNLIMWAHYADQHRGFVLQFDESHDFFSTVHHPKLEMEIGLRRVDYTAERPKASASNLASLIEVLYRKSPAWQCEREWRLIRPLSAAAKWLGAEQPAVGLFLVPAGAIRAVVIGALMPHEQQVALINLLDSSPALKYVSRHNVRLHPIEYALEIYPPLDGNPSGLVSGFASARPPATVSVFGDESPGVNLPANGEADLKTPFT